MLSEALEYQVYLSEPNRTVHLRSISEVKAFVSFVTLLESSAWSHQRHLPHTVNYDRHLPHLHEDGKLGVRDPRTEHLIASSPVFPSSSNNFVYYMGSDG